MKINAVDIINENAFGYARTGIAAIDGAAACTREGDAFNPCAAVFTVPEFKDGICLFSID